MPVLSEAQQKAEEEHEAMVANLPVEILRAAADYIAEHGWTKGAYEMNGEVCTEGAFIKVLGIRQPLFAWSGAMNEAKKAAELRLLRSLAKRDELPTTAYAPPYSEVSLIWLVEHGNISPESAVCAWNDCMARTKEDVLLALKVAAEDG